MNTALRVMCSMVLFPLLTCAAEPKRISQTEALELVTTRVQPEYPAIAKQLNLAGIVEVDLVVAANGVVESATPISGSPVLTRPAADALKKWKFKPLQEDGAAAGFRTTIKLNFSR
jgi:periplasmic protein TonB